MKKIMIITGLVLAIGASMTAGTMARYTQTLEKKTANIKAKTFFVNSSSIGNDLNEDFKLAPGEEKIFEYKIVNTEKGGTVASETDIKVLAEVIKEKEANNGNGNKDLFNELKVEIESDLNFETEDSKHINIKNGTQKKKSEKVNRVVAKGETKFEADKIEEKNLKIKVYWPKANEDYKKYKNDAVKISLNLNAIQE